jgi:hypothetical protein
LMSIVRKAIELDKGDIITLDTFKVGGCFNWFYVIMILGWKIFWQKSRGETDSEEVRYGRLWECALSHGEKMPVSAKDGA